VGVVARGLGFGLWAVVVISIVQMPAQPDVQRILQSRCIIARDHHAHVERERHGRVGQFPDSIERRKPARHADFEDVFTSRIVPRLRQYSTVVMANFFGGGAVALPYFKNQHPITHAAVRRVLDSQPETLLDRAFATIIRNRMQRGGIMAPGPA